MDKENKAYIPNIYVMDLCLSTFDNWCHETYQRATLVLITYVLSRLWSKQHFLYQNCIQFVMTLLSLQNSSGHYSTRGVMLNGICRMSEGWKTSVFTRQNCNVRALHLIWGQKQGPRDRDWETVKGAEVDFFMQYCTITADCFLVHVNMCEHIFTSTYRTVDLFSGRSSRTGGSAVWEGLPGRFVWDTESLTPKRSNVNLNEYTTYVITLFW